MKISIAMCTYNGARYLQEQLDSIAAQTRHPDELVVCDDRSSDETAAILEKFAAAAPFEVKVVVNEENLGSSKNFEKAITLTSGDVIALSDQDDIWVPQKLAKIEQLFTEDPGIGLVFSDAKLAGGDLRPTGLKLSNFVFRRGDKQRVAAGNALDVLLEYNVVTGAAMAFRSAYNDTFLPIPEGTDLIHDGWISLMIAIQADVHYIDEPLITYRQHSDQELGLLMPKIKVSGRVRHANYVENRKLALVRLSDLRAHVESGELARKIARGPGSMLREKGEMLDLIDLTVKNVEDSIKHFGLRAGLPVSRLKRMGPILAELRSGRYRRFSRGVVAAAADLLSK